MTKLELKKRLETDNFPKERYGLEGGNQDGRLYLECKKNRWFVYYIDHGNQIILKNFILEEVACMYYYQELSKLLYNEAEFLTSIKG